MDSKNSIKEIENIGISNKTKISKNDNDIHKLKEELINFDTSKLIMESLNIDKKYKNNLKNSIFKKSNSDLLNEIESNAISNFIKDLDMKNKNKIKNKFISELDKCKNNMELEINRKEKISTEYISKYKCILEENKLLQKKLYDMNNRYKSLEQQLKHIQIQLFKNQMKLGIFERNKKLFEDFMKFFPNEEPLEIMKGYKQRHQTSINIMNENENLKLAIKDLKKQNILDNQENSNCIDNLYKKIDFLKKEQNNLIEEYELKISKLNNQISQIQSKEEKNKLLHKMLYQIYNKLIDSFKLDKNIRINDKYLNIKEEDFKPNIFDDIELGRYIKLMITTTRPHLCDKLLRETIAYSNMILRAHLKKKINLRFDPLNTFRELKLILEEKEDKIKNLTELVKNYESKLINQYNKNRKLSNIIEHIKKEKIDKYLKTRKGSSIGKKFNKTNSKKASINSYLALEPDEAINPKLFSEGNKSIDEGKIIKKYKSEIMSEGINTEINNIKSSNNQNYKRFRKIIPQKKTNKNLEDKKYIEYISPEKNNNINKIKYRLLSASNKKFKNKYLKEETDIYKDPLYQSLNNTNKKNILKKRPLSNNNINKFKKIEEAKNHNKILKEHGNQSLITYLNDFTQFINHTNRLILYKNRISPNTTSHSFLNLKNKKISRLGKISIEKKIKSKIIGKINNIIHSLEMKSEIENKREEENDDINRKGKYEEV